MRKITYLLSLCLALLVGTANAQTMPDIATSVDGAKAYFIVNARASKNAKYAGEGTRAQLTTDVANSTLWYFINAGAAAEGQGTPVKIYNVEAQKYINDTSTGSYTDVADDARTWYIKEQSNGSYTGFAISKNADMSGNNSWNDFQGTATQVDYWASNDPGSIWLFQTLDDYYTEQKADYVTFVTEATANIGTGLFYANADKVAELNALLEAETPNSLDGVSTALSNLAAAKAAIYNMPTTNGKYIFKNNHYNNYLTVSNTGALVANTTQATRSVWEIVEVENGYALKNVLTGKYVQYAGASTAFTLVDEPVAMQLFPNYGGGVWGTTAIGGSGFRQQMHEAGGGNIVGWEAGGATNWVLIEYTDDMAADLATAEAGLMSSGVTEATKVATALGLDVASLGLDAITLSDILAGNSHVKPVYAAAEGKYYRFHNVTRNLTIGISADGKPYGLTPSSTDISQVWQLKTSGNGFKLVNANLAAAGSNAYIERTVGGGPSAASIVDEATAPVWTLDITGVEEGKFKIADGSAWGRINMEAAGNLNSWNGDNSVFTASLVESVEVALAAASIGGAYASVYLPFDVTVPADVKAYVGEVHDTYVKMTEATAVAANNGFILEGTAAGNVTLTIGATDAATSGISGTTTAITLDDATRANYLVFGVGKESSQLGFFKPAAAITTIAANKAFVNNAAATALPLQFGGEATGIEGVEVENANAPMFDLSGRRILAPAKGGIYIQNGKKFIVK